MPSNVDTTWLAYSDLDMSRIAPFATPQFLQDYSSLRQRQIITQNELVDADGRLGVLETDVTALQGDVVQLQADVVAIQDELVIINQRIDAVETAAYLAIIT